MTPFEATLAALLALPTYKEDRAPEHQERRQELLAAIAGPVSELSPPAGIDARDWRALVIAVGGAETHYSLRIVADGRCKPYECDRGRARSAWQLQNNDHLRPVWEELGQGLSTIDVQVRAADQMLKRAYHQCRQAPGEWKYKTLMSFAGRGCKQMTLGPWRGLVLRLDYWQRARRAMG